MMMILSIFLMIPLCFLSFWWEIVGFLMVLSIFFISKTWMFNYYSMISYTMGGDMLSWSLDFWIIFLMIMASYKVFILDNNVKEFLFVCLFLLLMLIFSFMVSNMFMFYMFFESSLVPTLLLIFGWGYQPERLSAGFYLLFYALFASLPLLLSIFYLNKVNYTLFYFYIFCSPNFYLYFCMVMAFLIKMPLIFFHFWLPSAHVEAPVSGSMILAGFFWS